MVRTLLPDPTQFDPESPYYDPKATPEKPRWYTVEVAFVEKWPLVPLAELKALFPPDHPLKKGKPAFRDAGSPGGGGSPYCTERVPMILKRGRNIPATIMPTMTPRKMIMRGSMAAVRLATASSTSRS